jgi:hypothetical protein
LSVTNNLGANPCSFRSLRMSRSAARLSSRRRCTSTSRTSPTWSTRERKSGSHRTLRWREVDSNLRSPRQRRHPSATANHLSEPCRPVFKIELKPRRSAMTLSLPANRCTGHVILGLDRLTRHAAQMDREPELKIIRRAFAKLVMAAGGVSDPRVEAAFAAVAREDFLGPGPGRSCAGAAVIARRRIPTRFT